jgi:antitoxin component of RelBE/YafQ-DinJ toxin-antitoxin module
MAAEAHEPRNIKVRTNIYLDLDVINFFKQRAKAPGALPYQTQINAALRRIMEEGLPVDVDINQLLQNEKLITAIAKRVRKLV